MVIGKEINKFITLNVLDRRIDLTSTADLLGILVLDSSLRNDYKDRVHYYITVNLKPQNRPQFHKQPFH